MNSTVRNSMVPLVLMSMVACATVEEVQTADAVRAPAVSPSLAQEGRRRLKKKIAIARFTNETLYGKSALLAEKADLVARQASDMLATRLTQTGKFIMFEVPDSEKVLQLVGQGEMSKMGIPADYLIVGSVSEFGRKTTGETGFLSRTKKQVAYAKVNVRLVSTRTGQVIFATEGAGEAELEVGTVMGMGTKADYDSTLNDKAISAAISKVTSNLVEKLDGDPWRSYVLDAQDGKVIIAGGPSQGLEEGMRLRLVKRGKTVVNPQTNLPVELPGSEVAIIEIESTSGNSPNDEIAVCKVVSGSIEGVDRQNFFVEEVSR
ncbi:MAG: curli production assembly protein CsgG [Deltaproteobacteria bacterium]|nr:MAG: curli production assembly protein CsgG [Deltaproteobacteria bacterium]